MTPITLVMYDLSQFGLSDMTRCGMAIRRLGSGATSMEAAADRIVRMLRDELAMPGSEEPACALVRTFVMVPLGELDAELQTFARALVPSAERTTKCLTLLATCGEQAAWNSRHGSVGHRALPLLGEESIARSPMIGQLLRQLGVDVGSLLHPDPEMLLDAAHHTFNVFHVSDAVGSPYIPAQDDFVRPYGIRSVIGFGGVLSAGELFATILFSRAPIARAQAELFRTLALNMKVALLPFSGRRVFA